MSVNVRGCITLVALSWALSFVGCQEDEDLLEMFDGPSDVAVMRPNEIFDVPVGFVSNYRSGKIVMTDLKHNTFLRDNPLGSWIRALPIATGRDRFLEQIAVTWNYTSEDDYYVTLFASDSSRDQLLVIPYLDSRAEWGDNCIPQAEPACSDDGAGGSICEPARYPVCLYGRDGAPVPLRSESGVQTLVSPAGEVVGGYRVESFWLRQGRTTTETWSVTYDRAKDHFVVNGSRSGLQENVAVFGETYYSDDNEIEFVLTRDEGAAALADGSSFTFSTDSGITEIDMPGLIQDLQVEPDQQRLFATVQVGEPIEQDGQTVDAVTGRLAVIDLAPLMDRNADALAAGVDLQVLCPEGPGIEACTAEPMAMAIDQTNLRLFIADGSDAGVVYQADLTTEPLTWTVLTGFLPNLDVAYVQGTQDQEDYQHLFVANLAEDSVAMYDLNASRLVDINPVTPEIDAIQLFSPIRGLAAGSAPVQLTEYSDEGAAIWSILVGATTYKGDLVAIKAEDGCRPFASAAGATVYSASSAPDPDSGAPSNPHFETDSETGQVAVLNPCGGITRSETWTFTYDETLQGYLVRGNATNAPGEYQQNIAYEDERYVSDGGEISVLIRAGTLPTTDGDRLSVTVLSNVSPIALTKYASTTGGAAIGSLPADLEIYDETYGDRNEPWTAVQFRNVAVVPAPAEDVLYKADLRLPGSSGSALIATFN